MLENGQMIRSFYTVSWLSVRRIYLTFARSLVLLETTPQLPEEAGMPLF